MDTVTEKDKSEKHFTALHEVAKGHDISTDSDNLSFRDNKTREDMRKMKRNGRKLLKIGAVLFAAFALWTALVRTVDVRPVGPVDTGVGFAMFNAWFHSLTGVHMSLYTVTDWLGLVPVAVCTVFCGVGIVQMIRRGGVTRVDRDILLLGGYYILVIFCYIVFEMIPINFRPILIDGRLEASYPSSTTLLVLCVMPTLTFLLSQRLKNGTAMKIIRVSVPVFSAAVVIGRTVSGVHWFSDIIGGILLSGALFSLYKAAVLINDERVTGSCHNGI